MAVAQGYGKTTTEGMIFAYDTGDTINSYIGEPTTNYCNGASALIANIDCSAVNATAILPDGNTGTIRRVTVTGDSYGGIIRANLNTTLTIPQGGVSYTISCWIRNSGAVAVAAGWEPEVGPSDGYARPSSESGFIGNYGSSSQPNTVSSTWTKVVYTYSYTTTQTSNIVPFIYFGHPVGGSGSGIGATIDFYQIQIEIKSHATPYAGNLGTRSTTQGLLDLTRNRTIDLTNVSYNSNAQFYFDGTDDNFTINIDSVIRGYTAVTFESIHKDVTGTGGSTPYSLLTSPNFDNNADGFWHHFVLGGQWYWRLEDNVSGEVGGIFSGPTPFQTGTTYHVAAVVKTNTLLYYLNGTLVHTVNTSFAWANLRTDNTAYLYLGSGYGNNYYFGGNLPVFKMYNRELTSTEVQNNYQNYKTRFNLS